MNCKLNLIKSIIHHIYILLSIDLFLFVFVLCTDNQNPSDIQNNYLEISQISSGNKINNDKLICSYEESFSNQTKILTNNLDEEKYILCFLKTNKKIYIFKNNSNYEYMFDFSTLNATDFSISPYIDENNLTCIMSYLDDYNKLNIVKINLNLNESNFQIVKELKFYDESIIPSFYNSFGCHISDISNKDLTCCFLSKEYIHCLVFEIQNDIIYKKNNNIVCNDCANNYLPGIRTLSTNKNIFFLCYRLNDNILNINCYIYNSSNSEFIYIKKIEDCKDSIKSYYLKEKKEFILICRKEGKEILIYGLNDKEFENISKMRIDAKYYGGNSSNNFFVNYNSLKNEYSLINDCNNNNEYKYLLNFTEIIDIYYNKTDDLDNSTEKATTNLNLEHIIYINEKRSLDIILPHLKEFLNSLEIGQNYEIKNENYTLSVRPTSSMSIPSKTHLNLTECESLLKSKKNINPNSTLTLLQLEIKNHSPESLVNKVEYKLYVDNYTELDLSLCENLNMEVIYGIKKDATIDFEHIISYQEKGINVFNLSDPFFNDICQIHSEYENDIILEDRIKDIFLNYSVCEEGCTYKEFDKNYYTFICECNIKTDINKEISENKLEKIDIKTNNLQVLKCYNLVFASDDKINNIGFWIFTFVLGGHVPLIFHFINTGIKPIQDFIFNEMYEYGYTKDNINNKKNDTVKSKRMKQKRTLKKKKSKKTNNENNENQDNNEKNNNTEDNEENENEKEEKKIEENNEIENEKQDNNNINNNNHASPPSRKNNKKIGSLINIKRKFINKRKTQKYMMNAKSGNQLLKIDSLKKGKKNRKSVFVHNNNNLIDNNNIDNNNNEGNFQKNKIKNNGNRNKKQKKFKKKISKKNNDLNSSNSDVKNFNKSKSPNFLETQDFDFEFEEKEEEDKNTDKIGINLININLNESNDKNIIPKESNKILNNYTFEEAVEYDKRPFFKIFYIILISKDVIFHTFLDKSPLELMSIKICVLIFIFSIELFFNGFFYFNSYISKKYRYTKGLFIFTFTNNILIILLSAILGFIILSLIKKLSNSSYDIREIFIYEEAQLKKDKSYKINEDKKEEIKKQIENILKLLTKKIIALFAIEIFFMFFFWYYLTAFCHVYTNTQISWILDSSLTIIFSFILQCLFCLIFAELYRISIDNNIQCLYKFIMFLYNYI